MIDLIFQLDLMKYYFMRLMRNISQRKTESLINKSIKNLLNRLDCWLFRLIMPLEHSESYHIELMPVILSGCFNQFGQGSRRPPVHSFEVYIGLIGFKAETLRGLFRAEVPR